MQKLRLLLFSFLISLFAISPASALVLEQGEYVTLDNAVDDDLYLLAADGTVSADVNGDLYVFGGSVTVSGDVSEDLVVFGGEVIIRGNVSGDVRVMAGDVRVSGEIGDDLVVGSGRVDIAETTTIGGTVFGGAGYLKLNGEVREDLQGTFGALLINGSVGGDVKITVQDDFRIDDGARVGGNLEYSAITEGNIPSGVVRGQTEFNRFIASPRDMLDRYHSAALALRLFSYLGALVIALILVFWSPQFITRAGEIAQEKPFKALGIGLLTMVVGLIAPVILAMTVIGIPLGIIVWTVLALYVYFGKIFSAAWLTSYVAKPVKKGKSMVPPSKWKLALTISAMLFLYYCLTLIPYIGYFAKIVLFLVGVGSAVMLKVEYWEFLRSKKKM